MKMLLIVTSLLALSAAAYGNSTMTEPSSPTVPAQPRNLEEDSVTPSTLPANEQRMEDMSEDEDEVLYDEEERIDDIEEEEDVE